MQNAFALAMTEEQDEVAYLPPNRMKWTSKKAPELQPGANMTVVQDVNQRLVYLWRQAGLQLTGRGHVAVVLMIGIDGRDMCGSSWVKTACDIGLQSKKSLIQIYIERIRRLKHLVA